MQRSEVRDDAVLLGLIATQRDPEAFSELFGRYKRPAYSLAFSILGDVRAAEEVVQESMIRVWSSAAKFRTGENDGAANPKGWILKIVARESSRALQQRKRRSKEISQVFDFASAQPDGDQLASQELAQALRSKVAELGDEDRQLIALHFGGGLSQSEISETMSVSQQTISLRLQRLLRELRTGLAASGFTCATAGLAANLESVCSSGYAPSSGLHAKVMARVNLRPSVRKFRRTAPKASNPLGIAAAALIGGVAVIAIVSLPPGKKIPPTPAPAALVATPLATATIVPPVAEPKVWRWTFEKEPSPDLMVGRGSWKWIPEEKAMLVDGDFVVGLAGVKLPEGPAVITVKSDLAPGADRCTQSFLLFHKFIENDRLKSAGTWGQPEWNRSTRMVGRSYFIGRHQILTENGNAVRVTGYTENVAQAEVVMCATNLLIREIEVRSIDLKDVPAPLGDPLQLTRELTDFSKLSPEELKAMMER
jgi:RNA polymerase sigma-70 factor (ECF subfamily)